MTELSTLFSGLDINTNVVPDVVCDVVPDVDVVSDVVRDIVSSIISSIIPENDKDCLDILDLEQCNAALLLAHLSELFHTEKTTKNIEHVLHDRLKDSGLEVIYQPNGTQNSPDFTIKLSETRSVSIECKSSKGKFPVWNGGLPRHKNKYIYIFHQYERLIYIFMAHHVLSEENETRLITYHEEMLKAAIVFNEGLSTSPFKYYPRAMYNQVIPFDREKREDWFTDCVSYIGADTLA